jgi:hypothetical protein
MLCFSRASVHPVALPRHIAIEVLWHNCSDAMHRRCVGSFGAEDPATKSPLFASMRPSDRSALPLDQGVGSSGAEGFVLARLCLDSNWASDRPTVSPLRPSDHPVLLSSLLFLYNSSDATKRWTVDSSDGALGFTSVPTRPTIAPTLIAKVPSVHLTVSFLFLFLLDFDPWFSYFGMWFSCILETYKCLQRHVKTIWLFPMIMLSWITKIKLELMAYGVMFATSGSPIAWQKLDVKPCNNFNLVHCSKWVTGWGFTSYYTIY